MELKYEMTKDDYLAFNLYHAKHSKTVQNSLVMQRFLTPIFLLILPFLFSWITGEFLMGLFIIFVIISVLWVIFYPKYFYGYMEKNINKMMNEGNNKNLLGQHVFIANEDGFIEKNSVGESKVSWSSIEKVEENEDYYFLFLSTMSANIIPKRSFSNDASQEDFKRMVDKATSFKTQSEK